jgi:hypothetical protein
MRWQRVLPQGPSGHSVPSTRGTQRPTALAAGRHVHIAMITAANTPHTITNALMICFSSETDIGQTDLAWSATTPILRPTGVVAFHESALRSGWERNTCASVLNATKPDRTIVLECNGRDCTNSMMRCGGFTNTSCKKAACFRTNFSLPARVAYCPMLR